MLVARNVSIVAAGEGHCGLSSRPLGEMIQTDGMVGKVVFVELEISVEFMLQDSYQDKNNAPKLTDTDHYK